MELETVKRHAERRSEKAQYSPSSSPSPQVFHDAGERIGACPRGRRGLHRSAVVGVVLGVEELRDDPHHLQTQQDPLPEQARSATSEARVFLTLKLFWDIRSSRRIVHDVVPCPFNIRSALSLRTSGRSLLAHTHLSTATEAFASSCFLPMPSMASPTLCRHFA